jgi:hypothetical protein
MYEVTTWDLAPGTQIERKELQATYGGRTQGGIGPSRRSPNVFLFSDPVAGEPHGYFDGWREDGCFHYTGEGQYGDQEMKSGNAAILRHAEEDRALRVFMGARGVVTYEDEFELDSEQPFYETDAPETNNGPIRKVIVFRLRPKSIEPKASQSKLDAALDGLVEEVPIEEQWTEKVFIAPSHEERQAERREQKLVKALEAHLKKKGHEVRRLKIVPPGEAKPIFCDLRDVTANSLVEAKGSVTREAIRMAIGQVADYSRFVGNSPVRAVLVPEKPRGDLLALLETQSIAAIWPVGEGFVDTAGGLLVGAAGPSA